MIRGFYAAAAGMLSGQRKIDVISNNLANTSTAGYKAQSTIESGCAEGALFRIESDRPGAQLGAATLITATADAHIDFSQGFVEQTGRSLDVAIRGEGFFVVKSDTQGDILTRNGNFSLNDKRNLIIPGVGKVLGEGGREITLKSADFVVGKDGKIYEDGKVTATLYIAVPSDSNHPEIFSEGLYKSSGSIKKAAADSYGIEQGALEASNVNVAKELSRLIAGQGHFQSCAQILRIYDRINELSANRIGSLD